MIRKIYRERIKASWEIVEKETVDEIIFRTTNPRNRPILELKACGGMRIVEVDLYAGTRHTSITEIARRRGEVAAKKSSGYSTNKAFERYCRVQDRTALEMAKIKEETIRGGEVIDFEQLKAKK